MKLNLKGKQNLTTRSTDLNLGKQTLSATKNVLKEERRNLNALNMGNEGETQDGNESGSGVSPERFLNKKERRLWNRLSSGKKEFYLKKGRMTGGMGQPGRSSVSGGNTPKNVRGIRYNGPAGEDQKLQQRLVPAEEQHYRRAMATRKGGRTGRTESGMGPGSGALHRSAAASDSGRRTTGNLGSVGTIWERQGTLSTGTAGKTQVATASTTAAKQAATAGAATAAAAGSAAATAGVSEAVRQSKKVADAFKQALESKSINQNEILQTLSNHSQSMMQGGDFSSFSGGVRFVAGVGMAMVSLFLSVGFTLIGGVLTSIFAILAPMLAVLVIVTTVLTAIFSVVSVERRANPAGYDLPEIIDEEMMEAFFETQEEYGIPVSSGIAQVIGESRGQYGPGLSQLAYEYKNLFGIKYFSGDSFASGVINFSTGEQTPSGDGYITVAGFSVYRNYADSIRQRAWMLMREPYYSKTVARYPNKNDGGYTVAEANGFASGIREAGWATDIAYVQKLIQYMEEYNLYRFDNMTFAEFRAGQSAGGGNITYNGTVTPQMQRIVDVARNDAGTYPCVSNMCAAWVTGVYQAAGYGTVPYGNAIDMWNMYSATGSNGTDNIPPGAVVCGSGSGYMGSLYGHVGIYLGDGMIAHNAGYLSIQTIDEWASWQSATCQGYTGWIGWVYPGGIPGQ